MMNNQTSNPIYEYAARGLASENKAQWPQAIQWYQKALACLPNLFGADHPLGTSSPHGQKPIAFTPMHAARIYAALGRCLMSLGKWEDSVLASRAAHELDGSNHLARQCMQAGFDAMESEKGRMPGTRPGIETGIDDEPELSHSLSVVVVTHCTRDLYKYKSLSPPSTKLLTATYGSLIDVFGDAVGQCPKFLCYDHNPAGTAKDAAYLKSVEAFSQDHGFKLNVYERIGLFALLSNILELVSTPYIMFVEHDWLFQGGPIKLSALIDDMDRAPHIQSVRFNKRINHLDGHDFIMQVETQKFTYPLLRTASHSNNPTIYRTDTLKKGWLPLCARALRRVSGKLGGSAFGVEEILFKHHVKDIRASGFDDAHAKWGTYVFGKVGDSPRIVHLGE